MIRALAQAPVQEGATSFPAPSRKCYRISRREGLWFIDFEGEQFGPYETDREAMLFAIEAAHQFGEKGEATEVQVIDEDGGVTTVWTYGVDSFPPNV
jgi:hypothetical protein